MRIWRVIHSFVFRLLLNIAGYFGQKSIFNSYIKFLMRRAADLTFFMLRGKAKQSVKAVGNEWRRMFFFDKLFSIEKVENNTVYANIQLHCPLRDTGNLRACFRLMEYDRRLLEKIGGEFVVLESQADPDTPFCEVAIRPKGVPLDDLVPAHEKPLKSERPPSSV